jgi:hypothetical protein
MAIFCKINADLFKVVEGYIRKGQIQFLPDNIKYCKIIKCNPFLPLQTDL